MELSIVKFFSMANNMKTAQKCSFLAVINIELKTNKIFFQSVIKAKKIKKNVTNKFYLVECYLILKLLFTSK